MTSTSRADAITAFWRWLRRHAAELDATRTAESEFFDVILEQLKSVDEGLWLEMSLPGHEVREFVVTASGDRTLFDLVEALVDAAPALPGWRFVALKSPMGFGFGLRWEGVELNPPQLWYEPLSNPAQPDILGLRVAVPGFLDELQDDFGNGVLMLLDTALGERSAATDIELVQVCAVPEDPDQAGYLPLVELANYIEWRKRRAANRGRADS
jgi:hypothetical protein